MMAFVDEYATALLAGAVTIIALLGAKLYECQRRLDAAEAKAGDYDALNRRLTEAKSLYYQRERTVAMAQKELVESARKRKAAEMAMPQSCGAVGVAGGVWSVSESKAKVRTVVRSVSSSCVWSAVSWDSQAKPSTWFAAIATPTSRPSPVICGASSCCRPS